MSVLQKLEVGEPAQGMQVNGRTLFIKLEASFVVPGERIDHCEGESSARDVGGALTIAIGPVHEILVPLKQLALGLQRVAPAVVEVEGDTELSFIHVNYTRSSVRNEGVG